MTKLQQNTMGQLVGTLETLADFDEQRRYKKSVPFVHIPIELAEQWSNYPRLLNADQDWFTAILSEDQVDAIRGFDAVMSSARIDHRFPDVEEVFSLPVWIKIRDAAQGALGAFRNNE